MKFTILYISIIFSPYMPKLSLMLFIVFKKDTIYVLQFFSDIAQAHWGIDNGTKSISNSRYGGTLCYFFSLNIRTLKNSGMFFIDCLSIISKDILKDEGPHKKGILFNLKIITVSAFKSDFWKDNTYASTDMLIIMGCALKILNSL